ncbi:MAG: TolC family protein [Bacteroidales bacterium]
MSKYVFLLFVLLGIFPLHAQVRISSLQQLFEYADQKSFSIRAASVEKESIQYQKKQAQSFLYPSIVGSTGFTDNLQLQSTLVPANILNPNANKDEFIEMSFGKEYMYNASVQAQWDIVNFQKIFALQTAIRVEEAASVNYMKVREKKYQELAALYYSTLITNKSLAIYEENVKVTAVLLANIQYKYEQGTISEAEFNRVQIQHLQNQKILNYYESSLQQLQIQLQAQLNSSESIILDGDIEIPLVTEVIMDKDNLEVLWQETQVRVAQSKLKQNKSSYLPSISLAYQYNYMLTGNELLNFSTMNRLPSQNFSARMTVSLFDGFMKKNKVREAKSELYLQSMKLDNIRLVKQKEDDILLLQMSQSEDALQKNKEILELQQLNDGHIQNTYDSGIVSLDERMDKYQELLNAQYNYLQELSSFSIVQYKLFIRQIDFSL